MKEALKQSPEVSAQEIEEFLANLEAEFELQPCEIKDTKEAVIKIKKKTCNSLATALKDKYEIRRKR